MNDCFYCENGEKLRGLMLEICALPHAVVYLNRDQKHPGRCVVRFPEHKTELYQLSEEERNGFFRAVSAVAGAIDALYHPGKINYAIYGDLVPHLHVHVVPKFSDGLQWGAPFDDGVPKTLLADGEYEEMISMLRAEIEKQWN